MEIHGEYVDVIGLVLLGDVGACTVKPLILCQQTLQYSHLNQLKTNQTDNRNHADTPEFTSLQLT